MSDAQGRRIVRPEDVERERQRQKLREEELHESLGGLTQLANSMTRQLDSIYYAILEKVSMLRVAVDSLQKLSGESIELRQTFEADANDIKSKVQGQIDDFGGLAGQEKTIAEMEGRIKAGTARAHALSDRLEQARRRVEQWEKREAEWQARTSGELVGVLGVLTLLTSDRAHTCEHHLSVLRAGWTAVSAGPQVGLLQQGQSQQRG